MRLLCYLCGLLFLLATACDPDMEILSGDGVELRFEVDTLRFDTVFASVGSATRFFKVYNPSSQAVSIDRIAVAGRTGVDFTINVDGVRGPVVENTTIFGEDSIYVFVEVNVDPTEPENVSPFIVEDRLLFTTGERESHVTLEAFGQNAIYRGRPGELRSLTCENGGTVTWTADLPYVIYGALFLDGCTLEMEPGTRVYIHGGVARNETFGIFNDGFIYAFDNANVRILGTAEDPVLIQTDRLEERFQDEPGQYLGLIFGPQSRNNVIRHARLLHGIQGVIVDSLAQVTIENSVIAYTLGSGISGRNADVTVRNSLLHSNFGNAIQFIQGVRLDMDHVTVANYGVDASALALQNFECFNEDCSESVVVPVEATIRNSILTGSRTDELIFADGTENPPNAFAVDIRNSVVRVNDLLTTRDELYAGFFENICQGCYNLQPGDNLFQSIEEDNYQLDTLSVAAGLGPLLPGLESDLLGQPRNEPVDAGCFERELD